MNNERDCKHGQLARSCGRCADEQEIAELRRDAERYRWLKQQFRAMSLNMDGNHIWVQARSSALRGPDMDTAIDAAMKA